MEKSNRTVPYKGVSWGQYKYSLTNQPKSRSFCANGCLAYVAGKRLDMQHKYCIIKGIIFAAYFMDQVFKALANRNRRKMLDRLHREPGLMLSDLIRDLGMTRQSASRHVSILESAALVVTYMNGREKLHYLNPVPVVDITDRWLNKFTEDQAKAMLALKNALEEDKPCQSQNPYMS